MLLEFTERCPDLCHSERSEESLKETSSSWRFFASLRMTSVTRLIYEKLLIKKHLPTPTIIYSRIRLSLPNGRWHRAFSGQLRPDLW